MVMLSVPAVAAVTESEIPAQVPAVKSIDYKQPVSKRKIAKKFLLAMGGVGISSVLLYVLLSLYNKIRESVITGQESPKDTESLYTPDNLIDAVRTFLDKTRY